MYKDLETLGQWPGYRLKQWMPGCHSPTIRADQFHFIHQGTSQTTHFPEEGFYGSIYISVPEGGYWIGKNVLNFRNVQSLIFILLLVGCEEYK